MTSAGVTNARLASTQALARLLEEVIRNPNSDAARKIEALLASQGTLARFSDSALGVVGCSLNTLKRSCTLTPGGFPALDGLRQRALSAIATRSEEMGDAPTKTTKRQLQAKSHSLKESLNCAMEDLMLLTVILEKSIRQAKLYAQESKQAHLIERCAREHAELRDMMSLRRTTIKGPLRVVS